MESRSTSTGDLAKQVVGESWALFEIASFQPSAAAEFGSPEYWGSSEFRVLLECSRDPNLNVAAIAKRLGLSRSATSQAVKRLVFRGAIERYNRLDNFKETYLRVEPPGLALLEKYGEHQSRFESGISQIIRREDNDSNGRILEVVRYITSFSLDPSAPGR